MVKVSCLALGELHLRVSGLHGILPVEGYANLRIHKAPQVPVLRILPSIQRLNRVESRQSDTIVQHFRGQSRLSTFSRP